MKTVVVAGKHRRVNGWQRDLPDHRDQRMKTSRMRAFMLPSKADVRQYVSQVEDQGEIGSCTANSATSAMETLYKKAQKPQPELSRLFLYYATRVWIAGDPPGADNGATIRDTVKALAKYGVSIEGLWPYAPSSLTKEPSEHAKMDALSHQALRYYRADTLADIRKSIADGYPLVGGFSVPASMDSPAVVKSGIVPFPAADEGFVGGHAVLFVGYNDDLRLLTFKNSWSTQWGDGGFGYLPYQFVTEWLASDFWTIRSSEL